MYNIMKFVHSVIITTILGCSVSSLDLAIKTANVAGTTAIAAHDEIHDLCVTAEEHADTIDKANVVIQTCTDAENAYGAFRSAWLSLASAIRVAQLSGTAPDNMSQLVSEVGKAASELEDAVSRIKDLVK